MSDSQQPRYGERLPEPTAERVEGTKAPAYGEYAPPGWVSPVAPVDEPGAQDATAAGSVATDTRPAAPVRRADPFDGHAAPPPSGPPVPGPPPEVARTSSFNGFATVVLLGFGIYNVISSAVSTATFGPALLAQLRSIGYPASQFAGLGHLHTVATTSAIAGVAIFLVVALWSLRRLRAGKNSWVPLLVAGLVVNLATGCFVVAVVFSDPSFSAFMSTRG